MVGPVGSARPQVRRVAVPGVPVSDKSPGVAGSGREVSDKSPGLAGSSRVVSDKSPGVAGAGRVVSDKSLRAPEAGRVRYGHAAGSLAGGGGSGCAGEKSGGRCRPE